MYPRTMGIKRVYLIVKVRLFQQIALQVICFDGCVIQVSGIKSYGFLLESSQVMLEFRNLRW